MTLDTLIEILIGPVASTRLRELANARKISPETKVRLGQDGQWVSASKVQGLFTQIVKARVPQATPARTSVANIVESAGMVNAPAQSQSLVSKLCDFCGESIAATAIRKHRSLSWVPSEPFATQGEPEHRDRDDGAADEHQEH